ALSLFVHVTLVPTFTVRLAGAKAKFAMVILLPLAAGAVVGAAVGVGVSVGAAVGAVVAVGATVGVLAAPVLPPPHAASKASKLKASRTKLILVTRGRCFFCIMIFLLKTTKFV